MVDVKFVEAQNVANMKYILEIDITNIEVDDKYYSFDYRVERSDEREIITDHYQSVRSWGTLDRLKVKKGLRTGWALNIVLTELAKY